MENAIIQRVRNQANNLKTWTDELQVQMALGKAEARDTMEKERKTLSKYFNTQKSELSKMKSSDDKKRKSFLTTIENLESSLYQETPTDAEGYDEYKVFVLSNIYKLEEELRHNHPASSLIIQDKLDAFKAKMDAFRVNLALHDKDNPEKVEKLRNDFTTKLTDLRSLLSAQENQHTKLDNFMEDISESYTHLKRAIAELSL